jgi:quercetin dioxygenase-like cupin family protein
MILHKLSEMKDGWFIGDFLPSAYRTSAFEAAIKVHKKDEEWPKHYQKEATEINLLIRGEMAILTYPYAEHPDTPGHSILVRPGDIFTFAPGEKMRPVFLEDCEVVCVKVPSLPGDKVVCGLTRGRE